MDRSGTMLAGLVAVALLALGERSWANDPPADSTVGMGMAQTPAGAAVFEMEYRGLSPADDLLSYRAYYGFGSLRQREEDPFVRAVRNQVKECTVLHNWTLPQAKWWVIELRDKKPVALYVDLNGDGNLSDDEKFPRAVPAGSRSHFPYAFITSDFNLRAPDQQEIPFRVMVVAVKSGPDSFSYMWVPFCVLEGQATLAGKPMKLVLYPEGPSGSFTTFGTCAFTLLGPQQRLRESSIHYPLSSLICHQGVLYRVRLEGTHAKDKTVRVVFEKDTTPAGPLVVALQGKEPLKSRVGLATVNGVTDSSIHLNLPDLRLPLPEGRYRLSAATIDYGVRKDNEWRATFTTGPAFEINAAKTCQVELGQLTLSVSAVDERERGRSDAKERSTFARKTSIFLTPQIRGKAGEVYSRFFGKSGWFGNLKDVNTHLTILDAHSKAVISTDMPFT